MKKSILIVYIPIDCKWNWDADDIKQKMSEFHILFVENDPTHNKITIEVHFNPYQ
jgi:hypothetical protein